MGQEAEAKVQRKLLGMAAAKGAPVPQGLRLTRMPGEAPKVKEELKQAAGKMQTEEDPNLGNQAFPAMGSMDAGVHVGPEV